MSAVVSFHAWGKCSIGLAFRARFEAKGRFASYLAAIPTYVIFILPRPCLALPTH
jgi:hypothetical protein